MMRMFKDGDIVRVKDECCHVPGAHFSETTKAFCGHTFIVEFVDSSGWIELSPTPESVDIRDSNGGDVSGHRFVSDWLEMMPTPKDVSSDDLDQFFDEI